MHKLHLCFMRPEAQALYDGAPKYATVGSAGLDLRACFAEPSYGLAPGQRVLIPSGVAVQPVTKRPEHIGGHIAGQVGEHVGEQADKLADELAGEQDVAGFVYSRSGLGAKHGIVVAQGVGVIDADYRGEIMIMLLNTSQSPYTIQRGERVAQLVFQPIFRPAIQLCTHLDASARGSGGFGHTGQE